MGYAEFLSALFDHGRVSMPLPAPIGASDLAAGDAILVAQDQHARLELPFQVPALQVPAARWAATRLFRACQYTLFRDVDEELMNTELGQECPAPITAAVHYSVDLTFRYLPDLRKLAHRASQHDPLLQHLQRLGNQWPLSSVGMPGITSVEIGGIASSPALLQLYVDRVIAASDRSRLNDAVVRDLIASAMGSHPTVAQELRSALAEFSEKLPSP